MSADQVYILTFLIDSVARNDGREAAQRVAKHILHLLLNGKDLPLPGFITEYIDGIINSSKDAGQIDTD
jgi:hypothetical protein